MAAEVEQFGPVWKFQVSDATLRQGTLRSILAIVRMVANGIAPRRILFLDADLMWLSLIGPWLTRLLPSLDQLSLICLYGPEQLARGPFRRWMIRRMLRAKGCRLFLRTEELAGAWRRSLGLTDAGALSTLPSLEVAELRRPPPRRKSSRLLKFGVLGQIRAGKGLEWLVPFFRAHREAGELSIAGPFFGDADREALGVVAGWSGLVDGFLSEAEMLAIAEAQDYLLVLYDQWDSRMEAATLFLAARVVRPVVVYDEGWCGRMVRTYHCGVLAPRGLHDNPEFFRSLPKPGDAAYQALIDGMTEFGRVHGGTRAKDAFLAKLLGPTTAE